MKGPRAVLKARRDRRLLADAIDRAYYLSQLDAPLPPEFDVVEHYLTEGWRIPIDPIPGFDSRHYAAAYPDAVAGGQPPFLHYVAYGQAENRHPEPVYYNHDDLRPWFDGAWYVARNPDVGMGEGVDPFDHFIHTGWHEGRDPTPWFSLAAWREANPEAPADENPFALHLRGRLKNGYRLRSDDRPRTARDWDDLRARVVDSRLVDDAYYFTTYPDLASRGLAAVDHYLVAGAAELRNPGPGFDTGWWAEHRSVAPTQALEDFLGRGTSRSGRPPMSPIFDAAAEPAQPSKIPYAVHLHLQRPEAVDGLAAVLATWPGPLTVWASVFTEADAAWTRRHLAARLPDARIEVRVVAGRGLGIAPVAFADRAAKVEAVLCLRSDPAPGAVMLDNLLARPTVTAQALAQLAANPTLAWLCPESTPAARLAHRRFQAGRIEGVGWLKASALVSLAAYPGPAAETFGADPESAVVEEALADHLAESLSAFSLAWAPFVWPERRRVGVPPTPAPAPRLDAGGRIWAREEPAAALRRPKPLRPRSRVYDPARLDIAWVMPDLLRGSGGHMSILRLVEQLARFGHRQTIWIQNPRGSDPLAVKREMQRDFRPIPEGVAVVALPDDIRAISADAVIATEAWSAFPVSNVTNTKARFYLIQDYEPLFHPAGDVATLAQQTYSLGLDALTAGDWLLGKAGGHGMWARKWDLAVDQSVYFPNPKETAKETAPGTPVRIAVYARRSTPRRAVRLAFAGLTELHRRGVAFQAVLFGDEDPPIGLSFPHVHVGVATPQRLGELYRACDIGLVFSATNYSLVPLEMMACDLPVVELDGESTRAVFRADEVVFSAPDGHAVADALESLAASPKARARQASRGRAFVKGLTWERSARQVEAAVLDRLAETGARAIDTAAVCAPALRQGRRVSVVIPTYNGGRLFDRVLAAAASQDCPFEYDVLVIDSGSTDRTAEIANKVGGRVWLHPIDKADFQHGRTRNLGVELTDGEIVAFLTQDALPGDRQWLQRLVEGFDASPRAALAFGRHRAYPAHGLFAARDLDSVFDQINDIGPVFSNRLGLPSFVYDGGEEWRRLIGFHSDNNSALLRAAWKQLPYPEIEWGEDQVLGWEMVRQGFDKVYCDDAVVFHSHQRKASEQLQVGLEEGRLYKREFGVDLIRPQDAPGLIAALSAYDTAWGEAQGMTEGTIAMRVESLRLSIEGRLKGAAMAAG